jgi:agmatinase
LHSLPPFTFCGTEGLDFASSRVVVLPVPYDSTASYKPGARGGPHAIIQASQNMELFDEELCTVPADAGIFTLDELEPSMKSPEDNCSRVQSAVAEIYAAGKFPVVFGGDHSVSIGAVRAAAEANEGVTVLHLDAHADFRDSYEGTKYSHACVARRFSESCPVVQMGIRSLSEEESHAMAESDSVKTIFMQELRRDGLEQSLDRAAELVGGSVYISLDIDVMDPSEVPATGTPEPGGLRWEEITFALRHFCEKKKIVGFDLVELSPIAGMHASDFLASRLAYKFIAYKFKGRPQNP